MMWRRDSLGARALRSSTWTTFGYVVSQAIRLASNLILTRLLVPEAFGVMALVTSLIVGLQMFSDMGTGPAVQKSASGDDPEFLDTVWTVQVVRGVVLTGLAAAIAWPVAWLYGEPIFAQVFPVAALSLFIGGFMPTAVDTAMRHLQVGRLTRLELLAQLLGIAVTIALAAAMRSVWALVWGGVVSSAISVAVMRFGLGGRANRLCWAPGPLQELSGFGRWILLSTICGFLIFNGDRLVLGAYLSMDELGIYNIAYFLGSVPILLGSAISGRLFIPLYRDSPPAESPENARRIAAIRLRLSGFLLVLVAVLAFSGEWLVNLLYDPRYASAGYLVKLIALIQIPALVILGYDVIALARGDSRRLFVVQAIRAVIYMGCLLTGAHVWGLHGALGGQAAAAVLMYPVTVMMVRHYGAWQPRSDMLLGLAGGAVAAALFWSI
ncbi:oligosaccharide flippase family protein [Paracoccus sp. YIM 132242]|uniref:Oligosaccharide flippase family protein n=1 Tax=Paracoccus lichenicola TaxID=2665644 RepID=A0A6L6HQR0_9RHOB|nr:oligosaccharide flippase family protein [Paracoccus lichenicola]MTE01516.1 oligosaccharide flippase family protein [Paracoccus lichenicola]